MKKTLFITLIFLFTSCSKNESNWNYLFDGKNVKGLRGYKMETFPWNAWKIENGSLKTLPGKNGVDIISNESYTDFELELEWKLQTGGNSGIFYYATEQGDYIWQSAPEMQVLDDLAHKDRSRQVTSAGALYDLIAPKNKVLKPLGEFNSVKIRSKDYHVEHWLNDVKVLEYDYNSDELKRLINGSKFKNMTFFSKALSGQIGLQGDHGEVWYRNIRIRKL